MIVNKGQQVAKGLNLLGAVSDHSAASPNGMFHVEKTGAKGFPSGKSGA
jgi:hypothetical protein